LIGAPEVAKSKYGFAGIGTFLEDLCATRSRQDTACDRGRSPSSILDHENIVYRSLGEFVLFIEE
jgi:hypothetical protein